MTAHERFATAAARLAVMPNVIRTRREDRLRDERNVDEFDALVAVAAERMERLAADLEKAAA
jgi:hypothetical protein